MSLRTPGNQPRANSPTASGSSEIASDLLLSMRLASAAGQGLLLALALVWLGVALWGLALWMRLAFVLLVAMFALAALQYPAYAPHRGHALPLLPRQHGEPAKPKVRAGSAQAAAVPRGSCFRPNGALYVSSSIQTLLQGM
jgi:hypothetical protein